MERLTRPVKKMAVSLEETGTVYPYNWYHNDILVEGKKVGEAHYDKKQRLLIGGIEYNGVKSKSFYHPTPAGIARKVSEWIEKQK